MDNHLLVSTSSKKAIDGKPRTSEPEVVDGDAFAHLFEKELDEKNASKNDDKDLVAGKETKRGSAKEARELDEQFRRRMGITTEKMVGTRNFIYNLALKDPGTLSLSERQSLHLGEFSQAHLDVKDFQNALADKGLHLKDLTFTQIASLTRSHSKTELNQRLDALEVTPDTPHPEVAPGSARPNSRPVLTGVAIIDTTRGVPTASPQQVHATQNAETRQLQRESVIRQIMAHIDVQRVANQTEVALKLNPEFLGDLKIRLNFEGRGNIAADFETTSKATRDLIDEGLDGLRESFGRQGMTLTRSRALLVDHVS